MEWQVSAIMVIGILLAFLAIGMPIFGALGLTSMIGLLIVSGTEGWAVMPRIIFSSTADFVFTALPMFILMGEIVARSGLGDPLYDAAYKWLGRVPGGLAIAGVVAGTIFGAVVGTAVGVAVIVGSVAIPQMLKYGYEKKLVAGCIAGSSGLGILIPPSVPFIMYGIVTENSIGKLFMGGVGPGIMLCIVFSIYLMIKVRLSPMLAPPAPPVPWSERLAVIWRGGVWAVVILIIVIIGGIYAGVMTPTEAAGAGCFAAFVIAAAYRRLNFKIVKEILYRTARSNAMLMLILVNAKIFSYLLAVMQIPQGLSQAVTGAGVDRWLVFGVVMILLVILGMFIDITPIILMTMPVVYPIMIKLGFDPIWFGAMVVLNMCTAPITPPVGLSAYMVETISGIPLHDVFRGCIPYIIIYIFAIILLCFFPQVVTWLPSTMLK